MKKIKFIAIGLAVLLIAVFFIGFYNNWFFINRYNATLYSNANNFIDTEFYYNNKLYDTHYLNPNYVEGVTPESEKMIRYLDGPYSRTFIITTKEEYDEIITNEQLAVDFEKQMVVLYMFSISYPNLEYHLRNIYINDDILTIKYKAGDYDWNDRNNHLPYSYARCFLITINKLDIKEVKFKQELKICN